MAQVVSEPDRSQCEGSGFETMAQGGEVSLQPSELVTWLEAKLSEKSIRLNSKQRQALEGNTEVEVSNR